MKNKTIALAGAGIVAASALALGGAALASADETGSTGTATSGAYGQVGEGARAGSGMNGNTDPTKPMRSDEKLLTGDTAAKVTAAARAKEPTATIERVETDSDGVYEAHLVRTDGTHVTVKVDASFAVTAVQEGGPGGGPGGGGRGGDHDGDGPQGQQGQSGQQPQQGEVPTSPNGTATTPSST
ncbi:hypothetical protein [Terrabacter carboxydivorans]|uniref:PepSY domain-containing protein n=1 Tax=Terrabacter carboxydivorans TaxID=619730 RepID=A0ABP5ZAI2_9MICO